VEAALRIQAHRPLMAALRAEGLTAPLQVSRQVTSFVQDAIVETFAWTTGRYAFRRGRRIAAEAFPTGMDAVELMTRGVGALPADLLRRYFEPRRDRQVAPYHQPAVAVGELRPDETLLAAHRALRSGLTVAELLERIAREGDGAGELQAQRALYLLLECELATLR
jgi:hypothetical protein